MITLTDQELREIRARIENVWDTGYSDKGVTLIESIAALVSIEALLNVAEKKQKPEHETQAIA